MTDVHGDPDRAKSFARFTGLPALVLACVLGLSAGCADPEVVPDYAVRVGENYLTAEEMDASLTSLAVGLDSVEARKQIIEQWVTRELIAQEALRLGLQDDEEVLRLVAENERSVLVSALLSRYYRVEDNEPSEGDIESYYTQHVDLFALKEDYLRVRYLTAATAVDANRARDRLRDATAIGQADSSWSDIARTWAQEYDGSMRLSENFFPQSRLFPSATLREWVQRLEVDQIAPVVEENGRFHVLQLADRRLAGTTPQLPWIKDELRERLIIEARKQMVARQVQRLRNEALARQDLEIH
ncbi:MAG: peptidyl-prolyl cis-trans isomerase [Rhodothermales bacterium]|nr:peptidyl-prolyl cis-trans isomerase [Rhodothermales bacterium]